MNSVSSVPPSRRLEGRVAIITGGASGIGASTVHLFHEHGANVVIADVQDNLGQAIAEKFGEKVSYIHCDVSNEDDVCNLIDTTIAKHGQLDIMYSNAGIVDSPYMRILDSTKTDIERVLGVNLVGAFLGAKHAARVMIPQRKGCILFTSSASASIAGLSSHAYAASKSGVLGLARNLAAELGQYGIRVNCVSPYAVVIGSGMVPLSAEEAAKTEMAVHEIGNLKGHILKAIDVAKAALYLVSEDANYISGLNLLVDGGYSVVNPSMRNLLGSPHDNKTAS
ncbi:tropinone reductase-like 1 [Juglans microcarpa x Juglans regia]|uniref:tropinone reductase-like 1 n=1 Tax=Juglans microcarpa x Juglans regia TaxID=2249226 RepID=UPI001B7F4326|nr:tropinone reductase-like 1 [Juglans microcarpa x Juglans regia]